MLTSLNPGIYEIVQKDETFLYVGLILGAIVVLGGAIGCHKYFYSTPAQAIFNSVTALGFIIMVGVPAIWATGLFSERNAALDAYQADVREWLSSDYSIDVTADEALKLVADEQIAVSIDGDLTAIHLINGPAETVQVQIVGGSVLTPVE